MVKKRVALPVIAGSGNVFADLGFAEPEEEFDEGAARQPDRAGREGAASHSDRGGYADARRSAESFGIAERPSRQFFRRPADAPAHGAGPRCGNNHPSETAEPGARPYCRRRPSPGLISTIAFLTRRRAVNKVIETTSTPMRATVSACLLFAGEAGWFGFLRLGRRRAMRDA